MQLSPQSQHPRGRLAPRRPRPARTSNRSIHLEGEYANANDWGLGPAARRPAPPRRVVSSSWRRVPAVTPTASRAAGPVSRRHSQTLAVAEGCHLATFSSRRGAFINDGAAAVAPSAPNSITLAASGHYFQIPRAQLATPALFAVRRAVVHLLPGV